MKGPVFELDTTSAVMKFADVHMVTTQASKPVPMRKSFRLRRASFASSASSSQALSWLHELSEPDEDTESASASASPPLVPHVRGCLLGMAPYRASEAVESDTAFLKGARSDCPVWSIGDLDDGRLVGMRVRPGADVGGEGGRPTDGAARTVPARSGTASPDMPPERDKGCAE